jgi:hypothetical protein
MGSIDDFFDATGSTVGFLTVFDAVNDPPPFAFGGIMYGTSIGLLGFSGNTGPNQQNSYSRRAGVMGASNDFTGVAGASLNQPGVYGQVEDSPLVPLGLRAGVLGVASTQPGMIGFSREGDGAQAASFTGTAFRAVSFFGPGVHSISGELSGVTGISGTQGPPLINIATTAGVVGTSNNRPGVIGTSKASIGVIGFSNNVGVFGVTSNPNSFAGAFDGNVNVVGTLTATVKNAVVPFPDGTQRVLHCMESPEHWFEDFGAAKLRNGRATVKLDGDFAKSIKPREYSVFVTPEGDCRGLYVRAKMAASFEVRELGGGKSNVAFAYRIVGRRRDIRRHRRFAKIDTRLPVSPTAPRQAKPTAAALRTFIGGLEREARARAPKRGRKTETSRAPKRWSPRAANRSS